MSLPLPKVKTFQFKMPLPLTGGDLVYRPYNTQDERILMTAALAKDSDPQLYVDNTLNVIRDLVVNDISLDSLPSAEVKLFLLNLRGRSVGEIIEFKHNDKMCKIDVSQMTINKPDPAAYKIDLVDDIGIQMRNITFAEEISYAVKFKDDPVGAVFQTIGDSLEKIFTEDSVWTVDVDTTREEACQWLFAIPGVSSKLYQFLENLPMITANAVYEDGTTSILTNRDIDFLSL